MKKYIQLSLVILFVITGYSSSSQKNNSFQLHGTVYGKLDNPKVFLLYRKESIWVTDSAEVLNGRFVFSGKIKTPLEAIISRSNEFNLDGIASAIIYLSPAIMDVTFDIANLQSIQLVGSKSQDEFMQLNEKKKRIPYELDSINTLIRICLSKKDIVLSNNEISCSTLIESKQRLTEEEIRIEFDFVKKNTSSFVSLDLLSFRLFRHKGEKYGEDIIALYSILSESLKNSYGGRQLKTNIGDFINNRIGKSAINFEAIDYNNDRLSLSDFRYKKYVLLDFWASWCIPCREDNPALIKLYNKYRDNGLEIIGLSTDKDSIPWKKAIMSDSILVWKHVLIKNALNTNIKKVHRSINQIFFVSAIPVKILIDEKGVIIGRWNGGGIDNIQSLNHTLEKIFNDL